MKKYTYTGFFTAGCIIVLFWTVITAGAESLSEEKELTAEKILQKIETVYNCESFSAAFEQTSTLEAMNITDTAYGRAIFKRPQKMFWEYKKPVPQEIISDGNMLWVYKPEDNQVLVGKAPIFFSKGKGASFLADIRSIRQDFIVTRADEKRPEDNCYVLHLDWKQKKFDLGEIYAFISKETFHIVKVETITTYGDRTVLTFDNIQLDRHFDDELFTFDIPVTAEIISLGQ